MTAALAQSLVKSETRRIRVRGIVQGVGFRPMVWRLATELGVVGQVLNDGEGVDVVAHADRETLDAFERRLSEDAPPLSRVDSVSSSLVDLNEVLTDFVIADSNAGETRTVVAPDAAMCAACHDETFSPFERRFRYPFTNCTHCGPRFSILQGVPYDRAQTTMAEFELCPECAGEYETPSDRRFHAQPVACHICGPKAWLERLDGHTVSFDQHSMLDDVDAIASLLQKGEIVAIKGIGGFHLACDATNEEAVQRLRQRKGRDRKPFALMARDVEVVQHYCTVSQTEEDLLSSPEAPIVVLPADKEERVAGGVAPGMATLGFMLPYTPLHALIFRRLDRPMVMTSGNISEEPQVIDNDTARTKLAKIADYALFHNREIANRVDDSIVRMMGQRPRILRRARGYAPGALTLPAGFEDAPNVLAVGGELKSTFCLVKNGAAILSQHQGDLENVETFDDYLKNLRLYEALYDHTPDVVVADTHADYLSTKFAQDRVASDAVPMMSVQHHHAHIAACLADNGVARDAAPVIGVALDGVGLGDDGTIWGGEFLYADYVSYQRLGTFKPVAMLGGAQAVREPWRNLYAHIVAEMGWPRFDMNFSDLELYAYLQKQPRQTLDQMLARSVNAPLASSCGRLFDAVAAAVGLCRERAAFEGEGAMLLEAVAAPDVLARDDEEAVYPFAIPNLQGSGLPYIEPLSMWQALFGDLILKTPVPVMSARFHNGLVKAIVQMVVRIAGKVIDGDVQHEAARPCVALSGGCFQNKTLLEKTKNHLEEAGFTTLTHANVPANDGGLALGQAVIAAAKIIET